MSHMRRVGAPAGDCRRVKCAGDRGGSTAAGHLALARGRAALALAGALLVIVSTMTNARAADANVAALFGRLAKERPARAQFHERKFLALLAEPVDSSGELAFTPPDRLEKRTTSPRAETVVVDGARLVLERNGRMQEFNLDDNPAIAVLIESIRATLAGDLASLSGKYSIQLDGGAAKWRLVLRPRDASLASFVERIEIGGAEAAVDSVEIFQADGDRSVMKISPLPAR